VNVSLVMSIVCGAAGVALVAGSGPDFAPAQPRSPSVEVVAPGVVSLPDRHEAFPAEDPADGAIWFSVIEGGFDQQTIMVARRAGNGWAGAEVAPFSGRWGDRAPRFAHDGRRLYFTSNRPDPGGAAAGPLRIWVVDRTPGGWSEPRVLPAPVNAAGGQNMHSADTPAALWLASTRPGGAGRSDIYRFGRRDGGLGPGTRLDVPINDALSQPDLLVDAGERWMILAITDRPGGLGGDDLYLARFENGAWTEPANLGAPVNSESYEYGPTLSRDGRSLLFTSHRGSSADVFRVALADLGIR